MRTTKNKFRFDAIIFDLDGTLVDSGQDLANSVNHARQQLGLPHLPLNQVLSFIGDGAPTLIRRAMGVEADPGHIQQAYDIFMAYYSQHMMDHTGLYPGVADTLQKLEGVALGVLTNKHLSASETILEKLAVRHCFSVVYGGNCFPEKKPDPMGVNKILDDFQVERGRALMVGDSRVDVQTGQNAGIATCGVTYGLSSFTLPEVKPDYIIHQLPELLTIVLAT
jgi:phosphoglycolate phosphatase